nr:CAP domain-containing protein [Bacillus sp. Marseille-P3661]
MFKKTLSILATSTLFFGLVACGGNNTDQPLTSRIDNQRTTQGNPLPVRDNGIYDGTLTEDYNGKQTNFKNVGNGTDNHNLNISASNTSVSSDKYPHTKAILIQDAKYKAISMDPTEAAELQKQLQQQLKQQLRRAIPNQQQAAPLPEQQAPAQEQQQAQPKQQAPAQEQQQAQPKQQAPAQEQQQAQPKEQAPTQEQQAQSKQEAPAGISQYAQQVIDLTNQQRANAGLPALKADAQLSGVALKKSEDMQQNNYFSHTSPTYGSPFDMMRDFGVTYNSAGENIAQGQRTPQEVVQAWMNSPGHKANILSEKFTHIGVGHEQAGNHWTQMFVGR